MSTKTHVGALALLVVGLLGSTSAQEINYNHNELLRTRLDPIVTPRGIAGHVHSFAGTNAIDASMTYGSAIKGDCTTSGLTVDQSGYWVPQLYYKWRNGTYSVIQGHGLITYWFPDRGVDREAGEAPVVVPDDFRMVAGDMNRDHFDFQNRSHNAVSFECWGPGITGQTRLGTLSMEHDCENLRPQIFFPSCWNGVDSYKADNSHVTYPIQAGNPSNYENGKCPPGFKKMPSLFVETLYTPKASLGPEYEWYPGCFVFSNGDNLGLSYHADWLNGFPKGLLVDVFNQCPKTFGDLSTCPLLAPFINKNKNCVVKGQIVNEPIGLDVPIAKLPGNNPEFNPSKARKMAAADYKETSKLITLDVTQGGGCVDRKCTDYKGPGGGGQAQPAAPMAPAKDPAPMNPMDPAPMNPNNPPMGVASSSTNMMAKPSATTAMGGMMPKPSPTMGKPGAGGTAAAPSPPAMAAVADGMNAAAVVSGSTTGADDEEMVCNKQKKRKRRLPRQ